MSNTARSSRYEIRVEGALDPRWTAWFEGLAIGSDDSQTVISECSLLCNGVALFDDGGALLPNGRAVALATVGPDRTAA